MPGVWPIPGVLLAALLLSDTRRWKTFVAIAIAITVGTSVIHDRPWVLTVALSVLSVGEGVFAAWLIRRAVGDSFGLDRVSHACTLVLAGLAAPAVGGLAALALFSTNDFTTMLLAARMWLLRETLGILVVAPLVLAFAEERRRFRGIRPWRAVEALLVFGGLAVVSAVIFGELTDTFLSVPTYVLPFILWGTFRFGPAGSATTVFLIMVVAIWSAARGHGPLATGISIDALILRSQGAMLVATISFLLLASIVAERRRIAEENTRLVQELQQALSEVKTLQGFIPICAWCHHVRDDEGFWQRIEQYLDGRTDATFSHSICPSCAAHAHSEVDSARVSPS